MFFPACQRHYNRELIVVRVCYFEIWNKKEHGIIIIIIIRVIISHMGPVYIETPYTRDYCKQTQSSEDERKRKEYLKRTRKLLETLLCSRNIIKGINTWEVPLVRYSRQFLKRTAEELIQMVRRTRKLMAMNKVLHPSDDIDRLDVLRKEGGRTRQYWR